VGYSHVSARLVFARIVMRIVNIMKHDLPNDEFLEVCRQIAEHNMFR